MRTEYAGLIDEKFLGQTVTLYGWAHRRRDHGGVIFIDLRDREGLVQIVCDRIVPTSSKLPIKSVTNSLWRLKAWFVLVGRHSSEKPHLRRR